MADAIAGLSTPCITMADAIAGLGTPCITTEEYGERNFQRFKVDKKIENQQTYFFF